MEVKATARYVRVAPEKARQIARHVRGRAVDEALRLLAVETKAVARDIAKVVASAAANAEHNHDLDPDDLVVHRISVDEGPTIKRFRPRAMGRAYRVRKRTSHITVVVAERSSAAAS